MKSVGSARAATKADVQVWALLILAPTADGAWTGVFVIAAIVTAYLDYAQTAAESEAAARETTP